MGSDKHWELKVPKSPRKERLAARSNLAGPANDLESRFTGYPSESIALSPAKKFVVSSWLTISFMWVV